MDQKTPLELLQETVDQIDLIAFRLRVTLQEMEKEREGENGTNG